MIVAILATALVLENLFLAIILAIYLKRWCQGCKKQKEISRAFNRTCEKCNGKREKEPEKKDRYTF